MARTGVTETTERDGSDETANLGMAERLRRGYVFAQDCPSREVLNHITSRWAILVLVALKAGTHRFSALRRKISGVSEKMLAQTLQTLEADGFVHRLAYPVVPPKVEYQLTALGEALAVRLEDLADWIETHIDDIVAQRAAVAAVPTPRHASESVDAL